MFRAVSLFLLMVAVSASAAPKDSYPPKVLCPIRDCEARLQSSFSFVRYGLLSDITNLEDKAARNQLFSTLLDDPDVLVSNQAAHRLLGANVFVDRANFRARPALIRKQRHYRAQLDDVEALLKEDLAVLGSAEESQKFDDPKLAESIEAVGLWGKQNDEKALSPFQRSRNEFVLLETAKAYARLGNRPIAKEVLEKLARGDNLHYSTAAIAAMAELDEERARQLSTIVWERISARRFEGIQGNWLDYFFRQSAALSQPHW